MDYLNGGDHSNANYNPFRYRGYYYDTETSLYYVSSRYYDSQIGRFINPDDVQLLGANSDFAGLNLFVYCGNNPVSRTDNNGQFWHLVVGGVLGGIMAAGKQLFKRGFLDPQARQYYVKTARNMGGVYVMDALLDSLHTSYHGAYIITLKNIFVNFFNVKISPDAN